MKHEDIDHTGLTGVGAAPMVGVKLAHSSAVSIANNTTTLLTFGVGTETWDTTAFHDTGSNPSRITIPSGQAGKYLIQVTAFFPTNDTGIRYVQLVKNGSGQLIGNGAPSPAGVQSMLAFGVELDLIVGDYLEMRVYQNSGGALDCYGNFSVRKI